MKTLEEYQEQTRQHFETDEPRIIVGPKTLVPANAPFPVYVDETVADCEFFVINVGRALDTEWMPFCRMMIDVNRDRLANNGG